MRKSTTNNQKRKQPAKAGLKTRGAKGPSAKVAVGNRTYANVAESNRIRNRPAMQTSLSTKDGRVLVRHREFITDVQGSIAFSAHPISINPGLQATFPWLSAMAPMFESYVFRKLSFEYETSVSTATNGTVLLAIDYDAADASPATKAEMMSYHNSTRSSVWSPFSAKADTADLTKFKQRYIRTAGLAANLDIKTYDVANLYVGTSGCASSALIGELYVTYEVELITPQRQPAPETTALITGDVSGVTASNPFGTAPSLYETVQNAVAVTSNSITFNDVGDYLIDFIAHGSGFNNTTMTFAPGPLPLLFTAGVPTLADGLGSKRQSVKVRNTNPGAVLTVALPAGGTPTSVHAGLSPWDYSVGLPF